MTDLLSTRREVLSLLDDHGIPYELHEHERAFTIDDCLRMPFLGPDVTMCKNILLCNRQKTQFYLMLLRPHTPFRTAVVSKALGVSRLPRLSFCTSSGRRQKSERFAHFL